MNKVEPLDKNLAAAKKPKVKNKKESSLWIMYVPALAFIFIFIVFPFISGLRISFTDWDGFSQTMNFVGLEQYTRMFNDPTTWLVAGNTLLYGVGSTFFQMTVGLLYAMLLVQSIKMKAITRTIVYLPVIISPLIMGYIWYFMFAYQGGAINDLVMALGFERMNLLNNPNLNPWIIVFINTYQFVGISMIIFLAGLQSISKEYYEAARMDGASKMAQFKNITIPLLMPSITINVVLNVIGGLKLFDVIIALTGGGPGNASQSMSTFMYTLYFDRQDAGYAATQGVLMVVLILVITVTAVIYLRRKEVEA